MDNNNKSEFLNGLRKHNGENFAAAVNYMLDSGAESTQVKDQNVLIKKVKRTRFIIPKNEHQVIPVPEDLGYPFRLAVVKT
ncbi:MAG: hypothetical protein WDK96_03265 [Candidatus Paceibacterota bacterium]|jgi:hypothetical protein